LEFRLGRDTAFSDFANGFRLESDGMIRGEIEAIGKAVENILTLADGVCAFAPIYGAAAAEKDEGGFLTLRGGGIRFARIETAGGHAHPFPLDAFAGKVKQFAGLAFGKSARMDDVRNCSHQVPQAAPSIAGRTGSGKARALGKSKRFAAWSNRIRNQSKSLQKTEAFRVWATR
jgi:hypothetical protein